MIKTITAAHGQKWESIEGLEQASVIRKHPVTVVEDPTIDAERILNGLEIQVIDAYGYQRELSIVRKQHYSWPSEQVGTMTTQREGEYQSGVPFEPITGVPIMSTRLKSDGIVWVISAYKHPFRPAVETVVTPTVALRLIDRIWQLATEYPILIFNSTNEINGGRTRDTITGPRAAGFVRFHDRLLEGETPSVRLLK